MTHTTMTREAGPDNDASTPKSRRLLPAILIAVAVLLVAAIGTGLLVYKATIDRSLTENLTVASSRPLMNPSLVPLRRRTRPAH